MYKNYQLLEKLNLIKLLEKEEIKTTKSGYIYSKDTTKGKKANEI